MQNLGASLGWGLVVGASLVAGALLVAAFKELPARFAANLTAFGWRHPARGCGPRARARGRRAGGGRAHGSFSGGRNTPLRGRGRVASACDKMTEAVRRSGHAAAAGETMSLPPGPRGVGSRRSHRGRIVCRRRAGVDSARTDDRSRRARRSPPGGHRRRQRGGGVWCGATHNRRGPPREASPFASSP